MHILPEQALKINEELAKAESKQEDYKEYLSDRNSSKRDDTLGTRIYDEPTELSFQRSRSELRELEDVLDRAKIIFEPSLDQISIGTKFGLDFGDDEVAEYKLVESLVGLMNSDGYISISSPLGKTILNHKAGDEISYKAGNRTITAKITHINKDDYIKPITNKQLNIRRSNFAKEKIRESLEDGTYDDWRTITPSQKRLLEKELRLINREKTNSNSQEKLKRLKVIRYYLKNYKVTKPNNNDSVSIGNVISLHLKSVSGEESFDIKNVELINKAISTEIEGLYLERISTLGCKAYGKRVGESFPIIIINRKKFIATVTDIKSKDYTDVNVYTK